ncbi:MAG: hypothetical protein O2960_25620 [Verrucomicrobia bacterium]|jgi:hypothetical protein|nr:hypothetical protein [Verrucomicrobiota bacterium]
MSQEIELYSRIEKPLEAIKDMGMMIAKSGLYGCEKSEAGMMIAWELWKTGKTPFQLLREYHMIEGKLSDRADSMLAKFIAGGGKHKIISRTPEKAEIELTKGDQTARFSLSFEEAKQEPFVFMSDGKTLKKNWRTPRARMQTMWARVVSDGVRALDPAVVSGVYTPEEIEDDMTDGPHREIVLPTSIVTDAPTDAPPATTPKRGRPPKAPEQPIDVPSNVVEMPVTSTSTPEPAKTNEPEPPSAPEPENPAPAAKGKIVAKSGTNGNGISIETIASLVEIVGEHELNAVAWLMNKQWIVNDDISTLKAQNAQKIFNNTASFLKEMERMKAAASK